MKAVTSSKYKQLTLKTAWLRGKNTSMDPGGVKMKVHRDEEIGPRTSCSQLMNQNLENPFGLYERRINPHSRDCEKVSSRGLMTEQRMDVSTDPEDDHSAAARESPTQYRCQRPSSSTGNIGDCSVTSSGVETARFQCGPHLPASDMAVREPEVRESENTDSPKSQSRIRLSKLTLSEKSDGAPEDEQMVSSRRRKRVSSRRVSSRTSIKQIKLSALELQDTDKMMGSSGDCTSASSSVTGGEPGVNEVQNIEEELTEDVDCPLPSTHQQKEARHLARLRQLKEMRAHETMESRRERALKRKGELSPLKRKSGTKSVSWKE